MAIVRQLPEPDPGLPDTRSATRYLIWLVRVQWASMTLGAFWGVVWMVSQALFPCGDPSRMILSVLPVAVADGTTPAV